MRSLPFAGLLLLACLAQAQTLQQMIEAMTQEPAVARAHWGVHVTQLNGTTLVAINEGQLFQPASNAKLFTTAAAMALLPMEERLTTEVIGNGDYAVDGTLIGNLILRGVGDANLSGRPVPYQPPKPDQPQPSREELRYIVELAEQVKAAGVTHINGDVVGDDSLFPWEPYPPDWAIDDAPWYYGAPVSGLMIADNSLTLTVTPSAKPGDGASGLPHADVDPALPYYTIVLDAQTGARGSESSISIERNIGSRTLHIRGRLATDAKPYVQALSIADPPLYAAMALKSALEARSITISGAARSRHAEPDETRTAMTAQPVDLKKPSEVWSSLLRHSLSSCSDCSAMWASRVLARHVSPPLYEDIVVINKASQNQHAELLLRRLGAFYGPATTAGGARVVRSFLTTRVGVDDNDFALSDGSGLSGHDLVTPRAITHLLRYATVQPWGERWKASFPVGGIDGSLRNRFTDALLKGHVFAKTGTLSEARALSGSLQCASGQTVVFSILVNAHTPRTSDDEKVMDRMVAAIAATQ